LVRLQKRETEMYEALQVLQNDKERILAFNELQVNELNSAIKKLKGQVSELKMREKEKVVKMHDLEKEKDELRKAEELVKVEVIRCKAKIEDM
jgi:peptidoglycan hydrolase CwlO-like protein